MDINGLSFRKIVFTIFSISFGLSLHAQNSLKNNAELYSAADYFAKKILHTQSVRVDLYDTYYTVDEKLYVYIFECTNQNSPDSSTAVGISSSGSDYPLLFFAYGKAADVEKFLSPYINEKKYLTQDGFYVKRGGSFIKIPERFYNKTVSGSAVRELEIKVPLFKKNLSVAGSILNAWQNARQKTLSPRQSVKSKEDTLEVKLTDVPLYLWYLNCGITMWTMYCAYWNDKGYSDLIPGGDSRTGHYWAVADELCYLDESPDTQIFGIYQRVGYYVSDPEYGYDYKTYYKEDNAFTHDVWNSYQETIERTHHPLSVGWSGPPYGAHATLGVGFQIIDSMKFFILHDTWRDVPYYVNYNQYKSSLNGWCHWYFDSLNSFPQKIDYSKFPLGSKTISLSKINARFSPGLNTNNNSYHSFFIDDINADSTTEFLTGRFNNYSFPSLLLYTLSDSGFYWDNRFWPSLIQYACIEDIEIQDFDNDSQSDAAVTGFFSPVYLFRSIGRDFTGTYTILAKTDSAVRGFSDVEFGDIDNDGFKDLIAATIDGRLFIYMNTNGIFSQYKIIDNRRQSLKVKLVDMNNDSLPDIVTSFRTKSIAVFYNKKGSFESSPGYTYKNGIGAMAFAVGDIDNDGFQDIITADKGSLMVLKNNKGNLPDEPAALKNEIPCYARNMKLADLNNDGFKDLIIANYNTPNLIFLSDSGRFEPRPSWIADQTDPSYEIRTWHSKDSSQLFLGFGKSRGGNLDFYKVNPPLVDVKQLNAAAHPERFYLYQNYPNPFNQSTIIKYSLPAGRIVRITIFDLLGNEVATPVNEFKQAGTHSYSFIGSGLPSGIYFCRIQAGDFSAVKKLILLK